MQKVQHITDKELLILRYFYKEEEAHVRQIKKNVRMSEHTLLKYLSILEKSKMLTSRRQGNLKIYRVNPLNPFVSVFFSYFDLQRLGALEFRRKKAIEDFITMLKDVKMPYFVLLFGSTAKGNYAPKSDIDMIVVYDIVNKKTLSSLNPIKKKIFAETGLKINIIIMALSEFEREKRNKNNFAFQDALQYGFPIFGNTIFHGAV